MKRALLLMVVLLAIPAFGAPCPWNFTAGGYPVVGCTVNTGTVGSGTVATWSWVWPNTTLGLPPSAAGWHRNLFDPVIGRMITYQETTVPKNEVTFSYEWWSIPWQTTVAANPWIDESTCNDGTYGATTTTTFHQTVQSPGIGIGDTSITIPTTASSTGPQNYFPGPAYLRIDDEVIKYTSYTCTNNNCKAAGTGTFTGLTRGSRNTTPAAHSTGVDIWQACPNPQFYSRRINAITAANPDFTDGPEGQHPWRETAIDTNHERIWRYDGKPEIGSFFTTWYYTINGTGSADPFWTKLPISSSNASLLQDHRDGAIEYGTADDVLLQYGGGASSIKDTNLLCTNAATIANVPACVSLNNWGLMTPTCYGTQWTGSTCPLARSWIAIIYDSNINRFVLFGGGTGGSILCLPATVGNPTTWTSTSCPTEPNDVWIINPEDNTWRQVIVSGDIPAPSRRPAFTYNSAEKVEVLWEGPLTYASNGNPNVGWYESGIYKLKITNVPANGNVGGTATGIWTIQGATGCNVSPCASGPPAPYSQGSANSNQGGCNSTNNTIETYGVPAAWQSATPYTLNQLVWMSTGSGLSTRWYLQQVTTAGTSGGTPPTWSTTTGGTTSDGTNGLVWTNRGIISYTCDHASENLTYDSNDAGYFFEDIDTSSSGSHSRFLVWQIPAVAVSSSTSPNPPTPAPVVTVTQVGSGQVTLSWTVSNGATVYSVYYCSSACGTPPPLTGYTLFGSTGNTSINVTGLTNGTTYTFEVVAANGAGSTYSATPLPTATPVAGNDIVPSPTTLNFNNQFLSTTSAAQTVQLSNPGAGSVTISGYSITGDFAFSTSTGNPCGATLGAGANCTINITFSPTTTGLRNGTFTINGNNGGAITRTVSLQGNGVVLRPNQIIGVTVRH